MKLETIEKLETRLKAISNAIADGTVLDSREHQYSIDFCISELQRERQLLARNSAIGNAARWPGREALLVEVRGAK